MWLARATLGVPQCVAMQLREHRSMIQSGYRWLPQRVWEVATLAVGRQIYACMHVGAEGQSSSSPPVAVLGVAGQLLACGCPCL